MAAKVNLCTIVLSLMFLAIWMCFDQHRSRVPAVVSEIRTLPVRLSDNPSLARYSAIAHKLSGYSSHERMEVAHTVVRDRGEYIYEDSLRMFILARVLYDVPDTHSPGASVSYDGWLRPSPGGRGPVSDMWPISKKSGELSWRHDAFFSYDGPPCPYEVCGEWREFERAYGCRK